MRAMTKFIFMSRIASGVITRKASLEEVAKPVSLLISLRSLGPRKMVISVASAPEAVLPFTPTVRVRELLLKLSPASDVP